MRWRNAISEPRARIANGQDVTFWVEPMHRPGREVPDWRVSIRRTGEAKRWTWDYFPTRKAAMTEAEKFNSRQSPCISLYQSDTL